MLLMILESILELLVLRTVVAIYKALTLRDLGQYTIL